MITRIEVQNYRSFVDAKANLSPFTLVIGENGSGKSNFLRLIYKTFNPGSRSRTNQISDPPLENQKHFNYPRKPQQIKIKDSTGGIHEVYFEPDKSRSLRQTGNLRKPIIALYELNSVAVEQKEMIQPQATIATDGSGVVSVLDSLKTGDREDLFNEIERQLSYYIPSIEKLSIRTSEAGKKSLQVREKGIKNPFPISELSEGTKLILLILTILHQEQPPQIILLEDIDRGLHPRLFQRVVEMLRDIVRRKEIQIIATTHNPYLIDEFSGEEESVLIVEKKGAESTITSLADRLESGDTVEDALGSLWFSGFFGGVPTLG